MKKVLFLVLVGILALSAMSCSKVPAGYVGVKVYLLGGNKGIQQETLGVGRYYIGINEELYLYPTFQMRYPFTQAATEGSPTDEAFYFQNKDGVKCNFDVAVQAHADPSRAADVFEKFHDDMADIVKTFVRDQMRTSVQNFASIYSIEELYGEKKVAMIAKVEAAVKEHFAPYGLVIDSVSLLSDIRFPPEIEQAIVAKIRSTQEALQRENEKQKATAEAEIKIAQARGEAESNKIRQESLSSQSLEFMRIQNETAAIAKWNGNVPTTIVGDAKIPFINMLK